MASTLSSGGWQNNSLYETGNETYSSSSQQAQGVGQTGYTLHSGYSGSGTLTSTTTGTTLLFSTQGTTTTLGAGATITGGSTSDSACETGCDSYGGNGSGTNVLNFSFANASGSATYTTTFSSLDSGADMDASNVGDAETFGTDGVISSGQSTSTLTAWGTSTMTYSQIGLQTVTWEGSDDYTDGTLTDYETNSESYSLSDYTSQALGTDGAITGGTVTSSVTQTDSDSQSDSAVGSQDDTDPEGGPEWLGYSSQTSITTSYVAAVDLSTEYLGELGAIEGGSNTFGYLESNSDSLTESAFFSDGGSITLNNEADYSELMLGTETYAPGGAVSGGSDGYVWQQDYQDYDAVYYVGDDGTLGESPLYYLQITDEPGEVFSDTGTDVLGADDSIIGECDTYTYAEGDLIFSTILYLGTSASPSAVWGSGWDSVWLVDSGSSTLTTDGEVSSTDTYDYGEWSGNSATYTDVENGNYLYGTANESYLESDIGTITDQDGVSWSIDYFELYEQDVVSADEVYLTENSTLSDDESDTGFYSEEMDANGIDTSSPDDSFYSINFSDDDYGWNDIVLTETVYAGDGFSVELAEGDSSQTWTSGTAIDASSGDNFSIGTSETDSDFLDEDGADPITVTTSDGEEVYEFGDGLVFFETSTDAGSYVETGNPISITTIENSSSSTESGEGSGITPNTGEFGYEPAVDVGPGFANEVGTYPGSAVQLGTGGADLDTSQGVVSAVGGMDVHALAHVAPAFSAPVQLDPDNPSDGAVYLEDTSPITGEATDWQSHPQTIGYRLGVTPPLNSGMSAGTPDQVLDEAEHFGSGVDEDPTVVQSAPTPRAEQQVNGAGSAGGPPLGDGVADPAAAVANADGGGTAYGTLDGQQITATAAPVPPPRRRPVGPGGGGGGTPPLGNGDTATGPLSAGSGIQLPDWLTGPMSWLGLIPSEPPTPPSPPAVPPPSLGGGDAGPAPAQQPPPPAPAPPSPQPATPAPSNPPASGTPTTTTPGPQASPANGGEGADSGQGSDGEGGGAIVGADDDFDGGNSWDSSGDGGTDPADADYQLSGPMNASSGSGPAAGVYLSPLSEGLKAGASNYATSAGAFTGGLAKGAVFGIAGGALVAGVAAASPIAGAGLAIGLAGYGIYSLGSRLYGAATGPGLTSPEGLRIGGEALGGGWGGKIGLGLGPPAVLAPRSPMGILAEGYGLAAEASSTPVPPAAFRTPLPSSAGQATAGGASGSNAFTGTFGRVNPAELNFSQTTAGGSGRAAALRASMANGWNGPSIDAVQTPQGLTAIDNTRLAVARELGIPEIPVNVHLPSDPLPGSMLGRFGNSQTWGEALQYRTGSQIPPLPPTGTPTPPRMPQ